MAHRRIVKTATMLAIWLVAACAAESGPPPLCVAHNHDNHPFIVCTAKPAEHDIRLFLDNPDGERFRDFEPLREQLSDEGQTLVFAMNGGMYHDDRSPVGLYIDGDGQRARLNRNEGPGNFHLLPNGVFALDGDAALVMESGAFADFYDDDDDQPDYASQSGPMLVINGEIHPGINEDGTSRKRRNGVGVSADGETVYFVISDTPVTFHEFASLFRDALDTPNALYLDGVVSRLYAADIGRDEKGLDMGPIVGVVR